MWRKTHTRLFLEQFESYYKQNRGNPGNVAEILPEDYIFERLGKTAGVQLKRAKTRLGVIFFLSKPYRSAPVLPLFRDASHENTLHAPGCTFNTPSIDVSRGIDVDKREHLELLPKSCSVKTHPYRFFY